MRSSFLSFVIVILVTSSATAIFWTHKNMESQVSRRVAASLETVLNTTQQSLRIWQQETTLNASIVANSEEIRVAIQKQIESPHQYSNLRRSRSLQDLRQRLRPYVEQHGYMDFEIIDHDRILIASDQVDFLGQTTTEQNRAFLDAIFVGAPQVGELLPFPGQRLPAQDSAKIAVGVPVRNDLNEVNAALIFRLDAAKEFTPMTSIGRLGRTGDLYMLDAQARLLTPTRFQGQPGAVLRDPGGDTTEGYRSGLPPEAQPLTRMALAAARANSGSDLDGYRDYRGVPVVGAWVWDPDLGLALAAEMEFSEAYAPIRTLRVLSLVMVLVVVSAVILLMRIMANRARLQTINFGYQQALKARQDLMAIVAHDLKNPINSVALCSSVLQTMLETPHPDLSFIGHNLRVIHRSAFRMNRLIEDLSISTRLEARQLRIHTQQCDLRPLLQDFEEMVAPLTAEKSIEFHCSIQESVAYAFVDPDRLTQVLWNLVGNAIKFTPAHGTVSLSVESRNEEIQFCVKDSGPGIPENELSRIFDQYWQAQQNKVGSGLGLYISKGLVVAHGGRIWVETAVGEGTSVYFTIPKRNVADLPRSEADLSRTSSTLR